jgi:tetratricopeptide (TPR) repeat protein
MIKALIMIFVCVVSFEIAQGQTIYKLEGVIYGPEQFKKAVQIFPDYFLAQQQLGLIYIDRAKFKESIEPLLKAVQINPKAADAHLGLGMAYVNLDQLELAVDELKRALSLDGKLFRAHLYLGMALLGLNDLDGAEQSLKEAYKLGGAAQARMAHLYLASIYDKRKQYAKAINELETYVRENPKAANTPKIQEAIQKLKSKQ